MTIPPRLWSLWCDAHPAPRITVVFLVAILTLAALALTRSGPADAPSSNGAVTSATSGAA